MRFLLPISILIITSANCLVIDCDYKSTWAGYTCVVQNLIRSSQSDVTVTAVNGNHAIGKSKFNVAAIDARGLSVPRFFVNLNRFLPNLETVLIEKGMTEIHKEELAQFPSLKRLYLSNNELQVIEPDLFKFNQKLELIFFDNCKIKSVARNVFDKLDSLTYLGFNNNPCYSGHVENNRGQALDLAAKIYENCGSSMATFSGYGSESCVAKNDFGDFRVEVRRKFEELSKKLEQLMDETSRYVKIAKESCDTD